TGSKLKAFQNPQPSWGFSVHKKTCASAQVGVIHVLNPKLTSPINTSGTTTLTIRSQTPLAVNRNSVSQSVTKGL
ncbi:hypothetical protein ACS8C1_00005, partial [Escherichia albertii]|uniref:hypothetical protein n=1 Tax=Escherichia albertii TaxID=208962 RepID=UPI003F473C1F